MTTIRRVYIYLVSAITLQVLSWATITLLWDVDPFGPRTPPTTIAFEIATIVVALPLFLVHWLWAQRLARDEEERGDVWRRLYLYGMQAVFLFAFIAQVLNLLTVLAQTALSVAAGDGSTRAARLVPTVADAIMAISVLSLLWLYQQWKIRRDARVVPQTGASATVRRLYVLTFSAVGLTMISVSFTQLLRWTLFQIGNSSVGRDITPVDEISRVLVGIALWLVFWLWAQSLFYGPSEQEQESALRKFYLYLVVFVGTMGAVFGAALFVDEVIRRALGLAASGDMRDPLSLIVTTSVVWAYHSFVLQADARQIRELPRQQGVRRLYLYLVAGIGLAAFLGGLIGEGNVLIRALAGDSLGVGLKELLAVSSAALIAGLPVWLLPWRKLQNGAIAPGPAGAEERRSAVRKIYLYLYLFFATVTVLFSAIYILSQLLSIALGARVPSNLVLDLSLAIGSMLIAIGVWIYHGHALRQDARLAQAERVERLGGMSVAVVDVADGRWGCATLNALKRECPGLRLQPVGLNPMAAGAMGTRWEQGKVPDAFDSAALIVGSWTMAAANGPVPPEVTQAIAASPARKLLVPFPASGWEWVGMERLDEDAFVRQSVHAVKKILEGGDVRLARSAVVAAVLIIVAACALLQILFMGFPFFGPIF